MSVLTCWTCGGTVVFSDLGWVHAEPDQTCMQLIVAWPPPVLTADED